LSRLVLEEDALASVVHAPRLPGLLLFEKAMNKAGASKEHLSELRDAIVGFEQFVEDHAGDRDVMEIMVTTPPQRAGANSKRLEQFRKDGFLANSAIWGVSTKVHLAMRWVGPSTRPGYLDLITACGFVSFRRLRNDIPWTVGTLIHWGNLRSVSHQLLPGMGVSGNIPLIPDFCSKPLPDLITVRESEFKMRIMIGPGPVGNVAAADIILGWMDRETVPMRASEPGEKGEHGAILSTPSELLLHDVFVHKDLGFAHTPTAQMYGLMPGGPSYPPTDIPAQTLPVPCELTEIDSSQATPEVPHYAELVQRVMDALGWNSADFRGYRLRVKYPPIPAMSLIRHALME